MTLVLFQTILQTVSTTLQWLGLYSGIRASTGPRARRWARIIGSAAISAAWFIGIKLMASVDFFNLMHSHSLIGLMRKTSRQPMPGEALQYGLEAAAPSR